MLITAMANSRKVALQHIQNIQVPLSVLVAQIYAFGDTQTLSHWKKELRGLVLVVQTNRFYKKGRPLSVPSIVDALDQIAQPAYIRLLYSDFSQDPDYKKLKPRKDKAYESAQVVKLLHTLASQSLQGVSSWDIAETLINEILSW